jgi:hypothetical protein
MEEMEPKRYLFSIFACLLILILAACVASIMPDFTRPASQYNFPSYSTGWPMD